MAPAKKASRPAISPIDTEHQAQAKRRRITESSHETQAHNEDHFTQRQADKDLEWYRRNRYRPGGALVLPHLRLVRLFVRNKKSTHDAYSYRTPSEILRLLFFDSRRYAGTGIDEVNIERCILKAILWQFYAPERVLPDNLTPRLLPAAEGLQDTLHKFESWPTERDCECIVNALRALDIDLLMLSELASSSSIADPMDGNLGYEEYDGTKILKRIANWFTSEHVDGRAWRLWQNKVLAAAVIRFVFGQQEGTRVDMDMDMDMDMADDSPSTLNFALLRDIPADILRKILVFFDASSAQQFSLVSNDCQSLVHSVTDTRERWKRNLFFARASNISQRRWNWNTLVAKDQPFSTLCPDPLDSAMISSASGTYNANKFVYLPHTANPRPSHVTSLEGMFRLGKATVPNLDIYSIPLTPGQSDIFSFMCNSPFSESRNCNPIIIKGFMKNGGKFGKCIVALVGCDDKGSAFIGAGVGTCMLGGRKNDFLEELTICCRYLPPNDRRLGWPLEYILTQIRQPYIVNPRPTDYHPPPWKMSMFDASYDPSLPEQERKRREIVPLQPSSPIAGFASGLQLCCDLKGFQDTIVENASSQCKGQLNCINCGECLIRSRRIAYESDAIVGLGDLLDRMEKEEVNLFCNNDCFISFLSKSTGHAPVKVANPNISWDGQCWGCGNIDERYAVDCQMAVCYEHKDIDSFGGHIFGDRGRHREYPANFCSKTCFCLTLPEILGACEEWRKHPLTVGARSFGMRLPDWMDDSRESDASILNMLVKKGWVRNTYMEWVWMDETEGREEPLSLDVLWW